VSVEQMTLGMLEILRGGGFTSGGMNFDAKLRRQSSDRNDLFHAHIGGMDTMARALLVAQSIIDDGELDRRVADRYAGWDTASDITGGATLQELHDAQLAGDKEPTRSSGHQEALENLVAKHIERAR
jgi:xylose isomerase